MRYIRPFLKIEWKNRNFPLRIVLNIIVFIFIIEAINLEKESFVTSAISFSIFSFVLFGLIWTITMIEDLKNDQDSNIIKTFVSYPTTPARYIGAKQLLFLASDLISAIAGSFIAYAIIGNLMLGSLELFLLAISFAILASRALFFLALIMSRISILSETILIFYYFIIFSFTLLITFKPSWLFTMFPYMYPFKKMLLLSTSNVLYTNLLVFPIFYVILIILSFLVLRIFKWRVLFNYD